MNHNVHGFFLFDGGLVLNVSIVRLERPVL